MAYMAVSLWLQYVSGHTYQDNFPLQIAMMLCFGVKLKPLIARYEPIMYGNSSPLVARFSNMI